MSKSVKRLSVSAVLTALSVALLYMSSILPTGRLAVCALSAVLPAIAALLYGTKWAVLVYIASSLLSLLILPSKVMAIIYALMLGHYTVVKALIERLQSPVAVWALKLMVFNVCLAICCALYVFVFSLTLPYQLWIVFIGGNVVFIIYDTALSGLINGYILKLVEKIR